MPYLWHLSFRKLLILLLAIVLFAGFSSLGTWQLQRRAWKLDLVARVDRQLAKEPVPAPGRSEWGSIGQDYAYLPVTVSGSYQYSGEVLVQDVETLARLRRRQPPQRALRCPSHAHRGHASR